MGLIDEIVHAVAPEKILFEAPAWISRCGSSVASAPTSTSETSSPRRSCRWRRCGSDCARTRRSSTSMASRRRAGAAPRVTGSLGLAASCCSSRRDRTTTSSRCAFRATATPAQRHRSRSGHALAARIADERHDPRRCGPRTSAGPGRPPRRSGTRLACRSASTRACVRATGTLGGPAVHGGRGRRARAVRRVARTGPRVSLSRGGITGRQQGVSPPPCARSTPAPRCPALACATAARSG